MAFDYKQAGLDVLTIETGAIQQLSQYINDDFQTACELMYQTQGKVVVMGMGKSGHIGKKIAASLASTGTPSFFVHPGEASHGDLGMIDPKDVVLCISNSGEAHEILGLFSVLKRRNIPIISMTGNLNSSMARLADVHLQITVPQEACPLGLAPTSSTTATLVMGDALTVALLQARGFTSEDFALSHPGGALGRKLLLRIRDIMAKNDEVPTVQQESTIFEALMEISQKGLGLTAIVNENKELLGIFTDGDLRRILNQNVDIHHTKIIDVCNPTPTTYSPDALAAEGLNLMQEKSINALLLVENNQLVGTLTMHHLLKAGVM